MNPSPLAALDLRDILSAPPPQFWPPAPGWWLLAALLFGVLVYSGRRLHAAWRSRRRRRLILGELDAASTERPAQAATRVSILLRRVALMCFARAEVAPLTGRDWLAFLDRTGGNGAFVNGAGRVLATAPYAAPDEADGGDNDALISLARQWITQNLGRCR